MPGIEDSRSDAPIDHHASRGSESCSEDIAPETIEEEATIDEDEEDYSSTASLRQDYEKADTCPLKTASRSNSKGAAFKSNRRLQQNDADSHGGNGESSPGFSKSKFNIHETDQNTEEVEHPETILSNTALSARSLRGRVQTTRMPRSTTGVTPTTMQSSVLGVRKRSGSITATGVIGGASLAGSGSQLRRGKWTTEEETYVARVIQDFNSGFLDAPAGTTLRTYLSEKLQCDPMRITKKFTGDSCIGKRVFHPAVKSSSNAAAIEKAQTELTELEQRWRRRMEIQHTESARKAGASAAAVAAAAAGTHIGSQRCLGNCPRHACSCEPNLVFAAGWLERARSSLIDNEKLEHLSREELVLQMEQVQQLLNEGPPTASSLPQHQSFQSVPSKVFVPATPPSKTKNHVTSESLSNAAQYKRLRSEDLQSEEAEDAAALVNFLQTVQAAAAASQDAL